MWGANSIPSRSLRRPADLRRTEGGDRIVDIGGVEMINRQLTGRHLHFYLNPERDMPEEAFRVHGLSSEFLADKPKFASIADELLEFMQSLRELSQNKPVGFKLCIGHPWEWFGIAKAMLETRILPDFIVVDGAEGGTGAAPLEFSDHMGMPLKEGLRLVHNTLLGLNLRKSVRVGVSGKIISAPGILPSLYKRLSISPLLVVSLLFQAAHILKRRQTPWPCLIWNKYAVILIKYAFACLSASAPSARLNEAV